MFAYHYRIMALRFQSKKFLKSRILQQYLVDWNGIIINKNKLPESFITPEAYKFTYGVLLVLSRFLIQTVVHLCHMFVKGPAFVNALLS